MLASCFILEDKVTLEKCSILKFTKFNKSSICGINIGSLFEFKVIDATPENYQVHIDFVDNDIKTFYVYLQSMFHHH